MAEGVLVLAAIAPFVLARIGRQWRDTVLFVMVLMVFEGALRKWVFPGLQAQIYLMKDGLLILALAGFIGERDLRGSHEPLTARLQVVTFACIVYCFVQMVNPNSPSPIVWAIGFKSYFLYVGLMFMVPYVFSSAADLERKLNFYMVIMIPVALLGLVQFVSPQDSWINAQVAHVANAEMQAAMFGEDNRARASGTFSYIGGFATFVPAMFALSLAHLMGGGQGSIWRNWIPLAMCTSCVLALFTTGSRTVLMSMILIALVMLMLAMRVRLINGMAVLRALIAGGMIAALVSLLAGDAFDAFQHRAENADDPVMRVLTPFSELLAAFMSSPVFGTGVGTAHNSASSVMQADDMWWLLGHRFELETARVMQETGIIGFTLVYIPRVALIFIAIGMVSRLRTPLFKALSAGIAAYLIPQLFLFVINNPTGGLYFWFAAGMLYGMYRLDFATVAVATPAIAYVATPATPAVAPAAPIREPTPSWAQNVRIQGN